MKAEDLNSSKFLYALCLFLLGLTSVKAQDRKAEEEKNKKEAQEYVREAEKDLAENDFASAEAAYRKAIAKDPSNTVARYNMGNLYYNKEKVSQAKDRLKQASEVAGTKEEKHRIFHNLGNSFMKQKNYQQAVEAYKNALRNDPSDEETRYNLALAKEMLKKQQQNQDKNKDKNKDNKNKDQNKDQNKDNKDKNGGDDKSKEGEPKDKGDDKKDQDKNKSDNKDKNQDQNKKKKDQGKQDQDKGEGNDKQQKQPRQAQGQLSPQQIKNLLEAMNNEEKKVQDKINAQKARGSKVRSDKDW